MQQKDTDIYFSLKKIFSSNPDFSEEQITYFCSKYKFNAPPVTKYCCMPMRLSAVKNGGVILNDDPSVDRHQVHQQVSKMAVDFFTAEIK